MLLGSRQGTDHKSPGKPGLGLPISPQSNFHSSALHTAFCLHISVRSRVCSYDCYRQRQLQGSKLEVMCSALSFTKIVLIVVFRMNQWDLGLEAGPLPWSGKDEEV